MARHIVSALDVGSQTIKAVLAEKSSREAPLRILGQLLAPSDGMRRGSVVSPLKLISRLKEVFKEMERLTGIPFKHAYLAFGSLGLGFQKARSRVVISQASGEISEYDVERVLVGARPQGHILQNREILESFGLNFIVDSEMSLKDPLGVKGESLEAEVLFITSLAKPLKELIGAVEEAGLVIDDVIPSPLAAARALLSERQREAGSLVLDIGAETTGVAVFEENLPFSVHIFPFGGVHITNDIALGFQVALAEAEEIKLSTKPPEDSERAKKKFSSIVEARLEDMFELVGEHLKKISRAELLPGGVIFGGGGARIAGLKEFAKNALKLPADLGKCQEVELNHKLRDPIWAAAVGSLLLGLDEEIGVVSGFKKPSLIRQKLSSWLRSLIP